jgi:hypothetical protein
MTIAEPINVFARTKEHLNIRFRQSVEYDDNISQAPRGREESDVVLSTNGGVRLVLVKKRGARLLNDFELGVSYLMNYDSFVSHSELSHFDHIVAPDLRLHSILYERRARLTLHEVFQPELFTIEDVDRRRARRLVNGLGITLDYPLTGVTGLAVPYRNTLIKYIDKELQEFDSMRNSVTPRITYRATEKTSYFIQGELGDNRFRNHVDDSQDYAVRAGIHKQITMKTSLDVSGGYHYRHFLRGDQADVQGYVFNIFYNQVISPKARLNLDANRSISQTFSPSGVSVGTRGIPESVSGGNPTFVSTSFGGRFTHFLSPRTSFISNGRIIYDEDEQGSRKNLFYLARVGLAYYLRRNLTCNLDYIFTARNSDLSTSDFNRNRFVFSINYSFGEGAGPAVGIPSRREEQINL